MPTDYTVKDGDCISSIAFDHGFFPETLWQHDGNRTLREQRKDMNVLLAGDVVHIPDKQPKTVACTSGRLHRFRRKGVPAQFRLRFLDDNVPRSGVAYRFIAGTSVQEGTTDGDGYLTVTITPNVLSAQLILGTGESEETFDIPFGTLAPIDTDDGVRHRLTALGYDTEAALEDAVREFQDFEEITPADGVLTDATREAIREAFGQ